MAAPHLAKSQNFACRSRPRRSPPQVSPPAARLQPRFISHKPGSSLSTTCTSTYAEIVRLFDACVPLSGLA